MPIHRTHPRVRALLAVLAGALAASACDDPSGSGSGPAASILVFSGNDQPGSAGVALANPVTVRVNDAGGEPVRGARVTWSTADGGSVAPGSPTTDASGLATAQWTLGPTRGSQWLVARVEGVADSALFRATTGTGTVARLAVQPDSLVFTSFNRQQAVSASALDRLGNVVGPITASYTSLDPQIAVVVGEMVRPVGIGRARIVGTSGAAADTIAVVVRPVLDRLASAELGLLSAAADTLAVGDTLHLYAVDSARVTIPAVTYASSAPGVAQVDADGVLQVRGPGTATISATREGSTVSIVLTGVVVAPPTGSLAAGGFHTCALAPGGQPFCWGGGAVTFPRSNPNGEGRPRRIPTDVRFSVLEAARNTTCGISLQGAGYCWGIIPSGGSTQGVQPIPGAGSGPLRSLSIGYGVLCVVTGAAAGTTAGDAHCWEQGRGGFWGSGNRMVSVGPYTSPAPGYDYRCFLRQDGTVRCNNATVSTVALDTISAGSYFGCGLSAGTAYCWGVNRSGQVGVGTVSDRVPAAEPVAGGHTFTSLSVGWEHACAVATDGQAWCWGANYQGQLGTGTTTDSSVPVRVEQGALRFTGIVAAGTRDDFLQMIGHTCAAATDGQIYCWGDNRYGQLGIGTLGGTRTTPARVVRPRY